MSRYANPGAHNGRARLTDADVLAIRASRLTHGQLARRYRIGRSTVWNIKSGRSWRHLLTDTATGALILAAMVGLLWVPRLLGPA